MSCGKWLCFCFHREKPHPTLFFPTVCEYRPGASGLGWLLQPTCLLRGFPLSEVQKYYVFPSNLKMSFSLFKCSLSGCDTHGLPCQTLRWVCKVWTVSRSQRFVQADHRHTNPTYWHLLEFCFLCHPAQPLLSVTAILGCIFPHYTECLDVRNFVIRIVLQPNTLL